MAKHNLNFDIIDELINDEEILLFNDKSIYMENPSVPVLEVKFPNMEEWFKCPIISNQLNNITTSFLRWTEKRGVFPDGMYELRYSVAPHDKVFVCKHYLRTVQYNCNIKKLLQNTTIEDKDKINLIYEIDKWVMVAKATTEENPQQSIELFKYANKLVNKIECK